MQAPLYSMFLLFFFQGKRLALIHITLFALNYCNCCFYPMLTAIPVKREGNDNRGLNMG